MTTEHEAYFYRTLYAVILISPNGGQRMNTFAEEDKAREDASRLIESIKNSGAGGYKVVLSFLDYSPRKNRIMSENIITDDSEILYEGNELE